MDKKITTVEAAIIIRSSPQFVRVAMQQKALPIGCAIKMPGSKHWTYNISPKLLEEYCGKNVEEELKRIRGENEDDNSNKNNLDNSNDFHTMPNAV